MSIFIYLVCGFGRCWRLAYSNETRSCGFDVLPKGPSIHRVLIICRTFVSHENIVFRFPSRNSKQRNWTVEEHWALRYYSLSRFFSCDQKIWFDIHHKPIPRASILSEVTCRKQKQKKNSFRNCFKKYWHHRIRLVNINHGGLRE